MPLTNIILLATYWNEAEWIGASLDQIDRIDPIEIIICDGCFDPTVVNYSTDGTRERIKEFVESRPNAKFVNAKRASRLSSTISSLRGHANQPPFSVVSPSRWRSAIRSFRVTAYRRNQALTFQRMISCSDQWEPGRWFMTYDADQFYSDDMIESFPLTNEQINSDLLTGTEQTFFKSFNHYTLDYETRNYNNMPHRIFPETTIRPTRDVVLERGWNPLKSLNDDFYVNRVEARYIGEYFHYKISDIKPRRYEQGYKLGDREEPELDGISLGKFTGEHPTVIQEHFKEELND